MEKENVYVLILLVILYPFAAGLYINEILSAFLPDYAQIIVGIILVLGFAYATCSLAELIHRIRNYCNREKTHNDAAEN